MPSRFALAVVLQNYVPKQLSIRTRPSLQEDPDEFCDLPGAEDGYPAAPWMANHEQIGILYHHPKQADYFI